MKKKALTLALPLIFLAGCTFSSVLSEIGSTISKFAPLLPLAEIAVCVVAGPVCSAVTAFVNTATPFAEGVGTAFTDWSTASAAAQPGKLPQLIAAITAWQAQLKAGLSIPGLSASGTAILEAELNAVDDLLTTLQAAEQAGGTTSALAKVMDEATPEQGPLLAFWNPLTKPQTFKLKNGAVVHSWKFHHDHLVRLLQRKTGNASVDSANAQVLATVKKLN